MKENLPTGLQQPETQRPKAVTWAKRLVIFQVILFIFFVILLFYFHFLIAKTGKPQEGFSAGFISALENRGFSIDTPEELGVMIGGLTFAIFPSLLLLTLLKKRGKVFYWITASLFILFTLNGFSAGTIPLVMIGILFCILQAPARNYLINKD